MNKETRKKYNAAYFQKRKPDWASWRARHRQKLREWYQTIKENCQCKYCGETNPICLDFHHKTPTLKTEGVSRMISTLCARSRIKAEIVKCDVICSNCHRKLHAGQILHPKNSVDISEIGLTC